MMLHLAINFNNFFPYKSRRLDHMIVYVSFWGMNPVI